MLVQLYKKCGKLGSFVLSFLVQLLFSQSAAFFLVLHGPYCIKIMLKLYFVPQIALIVLIVIFNLVKPPRLPKNQVPEVTNQVER